MGSNDFLLVYPYSFTEAKRLNELDRWKESHKENVACKNAIEDAIRRDFDGMHLSADCAKSVIEQFGYHRTAYVLANSLQYKDTDGRFSHGNHHWAKSIFVPPDRDAYSNRNADFAVDSHPTVLDGFVNQFRKAYQALGLFDHTHCLPDKATQDFEGKVIVLSADTLNENYLTPQNQLWLCTGGFGSHPGASGRGVFATCLSDGEKARWNRENFVGVIADSQLPNWAREKLEQLQVQTESEAPAMRGMTMQ